MAFPQVIKNHWITKASGLIAFYFIDSENGRYIGI